MYYATLTPIDLGCLDSEAAIIYNQDRLVALAVKLADPEHGPDVGSWNIEFYAPQPGRTFELFVSLDALIEALRRDDKIRENTGWLRPSSPPAVADDLAAAPVEIIEVKTQADGNSG